MRAYPGATALVVLSTGNHYVIDAVVGAALVLAADAVCRRAVPVEEDSGTGAPSGTRTPNPLIKSQLLCQLS